MKIETIEKNGKQFALVPVLTFEKLVEDAEMLADIQAYDEAIARNEEFFPAAMVARLCDGESRVRVFREHRGLTQAQLAEKSGVNRVYISDIETGKKAGSVKALKALAKALTVDLDDLA